jgi:hypothetical protein
MHLLAAANNAGHEALSVLIQLLAVFNCTVREFSSGGGDGGGLGGGEVRERAHTMCEREKDRTA